MPHGNGEPANLTPAKGKVGAIMVVGAGISGIQAALDLANSGFKVYLVDKAPAIGGKMAQLDKTFPTNDCSMCILSPKLIECADNPNVSIMTYTQVENISGEAGNFNVTLLKKPRYVNEEKCRGCPTCIEYCPVKIPDAYNEGLTSTKCIYIPFPQAVPNVPVIDPQRCLYLLRRECQICVPTCKNKAIDFHQEEKRLEVEVGGVILAPGYETFAPQLQSQYGYQRFSNVITSLQFERLLSATGPYRGELKRPSDRKPPKSVAWIQCVGSRDVTANNPYCSAVCCMYAIKQVILSKEHRPELETTIFHNDIRAYGKGFDRYYERAKTTPGVRFIWSKVSVLGEQPGTKNVVVRYRANGTEVREEAFDLVVLSVGLVSPDGTRQLAEKIGVELNSYGFCNSHGLSPMATSQKGIYTCGLFHAPMDIPDSVTMASGAASLAAQLLADQRGTLVAQKEYPPEFDTSAEPPRVGVFICGCGTNIAKVVDVPRAVKYAKGIDGVTYAEETTFACSVDAVNHIAETIKEKRLNRVVVAACTPRTHEPVFQEALRKAGLNPHLIEMANIREQCSWVHMREGKASTQKAQDLVRMAVAKAKLLRPLHGLSHRVTHAGLVIGGGVSGMVCALALARQGFEVHLVEKSAELGGMGKRIYFTVDGKDVQAYLQGLVKEVYENPLVHVHTVANVTGSTGFVGNFTTTITSGTGGLPEEIKHGVTIVATGAEELRPTEYLYGNDPRVLTLLELEAGVAKGSERITRCNSLMMIQCVDSRDDERPYCSRICCSHAIKNALKLREINPKMEIYVLYRDMRTYAFKEDYYRKAAEQDVKFIRYDVGDKPEVSVVVENGQDRLRIKVTEPTLGQRLMIDADVLALGSAIVPRAASKELSQLLKVPLNEDSFFMEAHMKLRPVEFSTDGIFMCGLAHYPKFIDESIAQAEAAASQAATILANERIKSGGVVCSIDRQKCSGCGLCVRACHFAAISYNEQLGVAEINPVLCKGCGNCTVVCLSGACQVDGFRDEQILTQLEVYF